MSLRYGFFDSEITGYDEEGMPIFDRAESSEFLQLFISQIISNGVLASPGDSFQVVADEGLNIKVRPGFGIVKGLFASDTQESNLTLEKAPTAYKRIDRVVLRANYLQRLCEIIVKTGTPDANPVAPELIQPASGDYYELGLATILINSNQTVITQSSITDTRYDDSVCGVVTQLIDHLDTSVFFSQLNQFYAEFVAKSNTSYEEFVSDMDAYLTALQVSGDNQLQNIVKVMTDYEKASEEQFKTWFDKVKGQLSEDAAGHLQNEIDALDERVTAIETVIDTGEVMDAIGTSAGDELCTDDGEVIAALWKFAIK